jgi:hypothetical protein
MAVSIVQWLHPVRRRVGPDRSVSRQRPSIISAQQVGDLASEEERVSKHMRSCQQPDKKAQELLNFEDSGLVKTPRALPTRRSSLEIMAKNHSANPALDHLMMFVLACPAVEASTVWNNGTIRRCFQRAITTADNSVLPLRIPPVVTERAEAAASATLIPIVTTVLASAFQITQHWDQRSISGGQELAFGDKILTHGSR